MAEDNKVAGAAGGIYQPHSEKGFSEGPLW